MRKKAESATEGRARSMKRYKFSAIIQRSSGWGAFVIFPHDVLAEFGIKGRVPVQARFDKLPYTGSLMTCGTPYHLLAVPKDIREKLGKEPGDPIAVEVWKDDAPRTVEIPPDFIKRLKKEKLLDHFEKLSNTRRKEYRNWITTAKKDETRRRRLVKAVEWLRQEKFPARKSAAKG
jgi:bifunctional DNA-binding transcriptional regulator/antitoxin component of YhaV-PrlF toxin-antitoxin module